MKRLMALVVALTAVALPGQAQAAPADTISADRATVRDNPGRLVLANAAKGDPVEVQGYCGEWVRVRVSPDHAMATPVGWVMRGHLTKASQAGGLTGVPSAAATTATAGATGWARSTRRSGRCGRWTACGGGSRSAPG